MIDEKKFLEFARFRYYTIYDISSSGESYHFVGIHCNARWTHSTVCTAPCIYYNGTDKWECVHIVWVWFTHGQHEKEPEREINMPKMWENFGLHVRLRKNVNTRVCVCVRKESNMRICNRRSFYWSRFRWLCIAQWLTICRHVNALHFLNTKKKKKNE